MIRRAITDQMADAYLLSHQQKKVVGLLSWGVMGISTLGGAVTWILSKDETMTRMFSVMVVCLVFASSISVLLLRHNFVVSATILMSIALHIATVVVILPYGVIDSSVVMIGFLIPLILLSYVWGRSGAFVSLFLTMLSYIALFFLERMGLTGWAVRVKALWVDSGLQFIVFGLLAVVIIYSQSALVSANIQLNEAQNSLKMFLMRTTHDLSAPVQGLYAVCEDVDIKHKNNIMPHLTALSTFVELIRAFVEIQNADVKLTFKQVSVFLVCIASMKSITRQAMDKRVFVVPDIDVNNPMVYGDELAVRRIIDNLLVNAIRFAYPDTRVTLRTRRKDNFIEISVIDNGPGLSEELKQRILERREPEINVTGDGWGIGLIIVRELTHAMGGEFDVDSTPGSGSTFRVLLPIVEDHNEQST